MIIFKDNKIEVEEPKSIKLDGMYSAVICKVTQLENNDFSCRLYIPEVFGEYDRLNILYPDVIIPLKQDMDDEGHVPQIGELVKVSFDDGNSNSCRLVYVMPMSKNSTLINKNYIENDVISTELQIDIDDPNILNKVNSWLKDAYYITIGKDTPDYTDFVYGYLISDGSEKGLIKSFFIKPLTMTLPVYNDNAAEVQYVEYNDIGYSLKNTLLSIYNDKNSSLYYNPNIFEYIYEVLDFISKDENGIYPGGTALPILEYFNDDEKIRFFILSICAICNDDVVEQFFPEKENENVKEIEFNLISTFTNAPFLWDYKTKDNEDYLKDKFSRFLGLYCKLEYEKKWTQACTAWISGINNIIKDNISDEEKEKIKKVVCICLTVCPWLTYTTFLNVYIPSNEDNEYLKYLGINTDFSFSLYYSNEDDFINSSTNIQTAIRKGNCSDIINTYEEEVEKIWKIKLDNIPSTATQWEIEDMSGKFERIRDVMENFSVKQNEKVINSINNNFLSEGIDYSIPDAQTGFKSFEPYFYNYNMKIINDLKGYIDDSGLWKIDDCYCVAMGSYYSDKIGDVFEVELDTGVKYKVITADHKADEHTDPTNRYTIANNCITEFIIDNNSLNPIIRKMGSVGALDKFKGKYIRITKLGNVYD